MANLGQIIDIFKFSPKKHFISQSIKNNSEQFCEKMSFNQQIQSNSTAVNLHKNILSDRINEKFPNIKKAFRFFDSQHVNHN